MRLAMFTIAAVLMPLTCLAQDARLQRPVPDPAPDGSLRGDETIGQMVVDVYVIAPAIMADTQHVLSDDAVCGESLTKLLGTAARKRASAAGADRKKALKRHDPDAVEWLAIETIADFDGIEAERIRADELIGPGVYRPAIEAAAVNIGRCRFY